MGLRMGQAEDSSNIKGVQMSKHLEMLQMCTISMNMSKANGEKCFETVLIAMKLLTPSGVFHQVHRVCVQFSLSNYGICHLRGQ